MTFPRLKSEAIAQYPFQSRLDFATVVLKHVDGTEQRFPRFKQKVASWVITLELLDDAELARLRDFFLAVRTSGEPFSFTDGSGTVHPDCVFVENDFVSHAAGEGRLSARLTVRRK